MSFLEHEPDIKVVGSALNGLELLNNVGAIKPDVIILDIEMPVMDGVTALGILQEEYPDIHVIILSMSYEPAMIRLMLDGGARAYLKKNCDIWEMVNTIREVYNRGYSFSDELSDRLISSVKLTAAELAVLKHLCNEYSSKEIAERLEISENTVETHRKNIFKKLGVKTAMGALKEALKKGLTRL